LVLANELLVERRGNFIPSNYDSCTALSDPAAYKKLIDGWNLLKLSVPASGVREAEFLRLVGICERRRSDSWKRPHPSKTALLWLCHNQRTKLEFLADQSPPDFDGYELVKLIDSHIGLLYGSPGHPFFVTARYGSLEQLEAVVSWCRPSQAAISFAAGFCGRRYNIRNCPWLLGRLQFVAPAFLPDVAAMVSAPSRVPPGYREMQALLNEAVWGFLFLRLSAESAEALVGVTEENACEIGRLYGRLNPDDTDDDTEADLLSYFAWQRLIPFLRRAADLAVRFAWLSSVHRAPRKTFGK
jgi:hypothetical protein